MGESAVSVAACREVLADRRSRPAACLCRLPLDSTRPCGPQYSFSLTTFSPSGKLVQIEHALSAVNAGATSLGIRATNGVVLATEKKLPSILVDEATVQKVSLLTPNVGMTYRCGRRRCRWVAVPLPLGCLLLRCKLICRRFSCRKVQLR